MVRVEGQGQSYSSLSPLLSKNMAMSRAVRGFCPPKIIQMYKTAIVMITGTIGSVDSLDEALLMASSSK